MSARVSENLLTESKRIHFLLEQSADEMRRSEDHRWMFSFIHASITDRILRNLDTFQDPAILLKFNNHFAVTYLNALQQPIATWQMPFDRCDALEYQRCISESENSDSCAKHQPKMNSGYPFSSPSTALAPFEADDKKRMAKLASLWGWVENNSISTAVSSITGSLNELQCLSFMAYVHINIDMNESLRSIGCVNVTDYGNILHFVREANEAALIESHGSVLGAGLSTLGNLLAYDKEWRNRVYREACGILDIPAPSMEWKEQLKGAAHK
jgi:hypothetical protein